MGAGPAVARAALAYDLALRSHAIRLLRGDQTLADDVVQVVWQKALRSEPDFEERDPWPWLYTVLHRTVAEVRRRERRPWTGLTHPEREPLFSEPSGEVGPSGWTRWTEDVAREVPSGEAADEAAEERSLRRRVLGAVGRLPDRQREAVLSVYYEGRTPRETARMMGIRRYTVNWLTMQARKRLRPRLREVA